MLYRPPMVGSDLLPVGGLRGGVVIVVTVCVQFKGNYSFFFLLPFKKMNLSFLYVCLFRTRPMRNDEQHEWERLWAEKPTFGSFNRESIVKVGFAKRLKKEPYAPASLCYNSSFHCDVRKTQLFFFSSCIALFWLVDSISLERGYKWKDFKS